MRSKNEALLGALDAATEHAVAPHGVAVADTDLDSVEPLHAGVFMVVQGFRSDLGLFVHHDLNEALTLTPMDYRAHIKSPDESNVSRALVWPSEE